MAALQIMLGIFNTVTSECLGLTLILVWLVACSYVTMGGGGQCVMMGGT